MTSTVPTAMPTTTQSRVPPLLSADTDPDLYAAVTSGDIGSAVDPYPIYRRLQHDFPVAELFGLVSVSRYDDVAAVLRHSQVSTDDRNSTVHHTLRDQDKLSTPYLSQLDNQSFLHRDPPDHTRLRKLVAKGIHPTPHRSPARVHPALRGRRARRGHAGRPP